MTWWGWLLVAWCALSVVVGVWVGRAVRVADEREWWRRGRQERRVNRRGSDPPVPAPDDDGGSLPGGASTRAS